MRLLKFAWHNLVRDRRSGELRLIVLALVIASASLATVSFFTDRIEQELQRQPTRLLGADMVAESGYEFAQEIFAYASSLGLEYATTMQFRSMLEINDDWQLVEIKAVSRKYPLRGKLLAVTADGKETASQPPEAGNAWVDKRLGRQIAGAKTLRLGNLDLRITETIALEPDRGGELFNIAPRLMMDIADVQATGLLGSGSRVKHGLLLAGDDAALNAMRKYIEEIPGIRLQGLDEARPELQASLKRARQFMGMASLLTVLLAGLALALAAQRYTERHLDQSALLRCLGAKRSYLLRFYAIQLLLIGLLTAVPGCMLGYVGQHIMANIFAGLSSSGALPAAGFLPWLLAPVATILVLLGFSLPAFYALQQVPPLHVFRRLPGAGKTGMAMTAGTGLLALVLLAPWRAADTGLTISLLTGMLAVIMVFATAAWLLLLLLRRLTARTTSGWSYGLTMLHRKPAASVLQITAIAVGLAALFLLSQMRGQILDSWRQQLPPETPNYFLINIDPSQIDAVSQTLQTEAGFKPPLYPMIRGRLVAINDNKIRPEDYPEGRARRLMTRNFNLSWLEHLPSDNKIVAGNWWDHADTTEEPLFTVEEDIATTMGVMVGDSLTFDISGSMHTARIASLRQVEWDSFQVNFFVAANPGWLEQQPATWISSIYLPPERTVVIDQILDQMPNITVLDIDVLLRQVRTIIEQIASALELVFFMTLAAGILVLLAALQISSADRHRDCAVLRTIGARQHWLKQNHMAEFVALATTTVLLATTASYTAATILATKVFQLTFTPDYATLAIGGALAIILISLTAIICTKNARMATPAQSLRL